MGIGSVSPSEYSEFRDRKTGVTVRQLTDYRGHSHHLYFTNPGWWDGGRRLLFGSDRANRTNLFSLELETGAIEQMTDFALLPKPRVVGFLGTTVNPVRPEAYFKYGLDLVALDLLTRQTRVLYEAPADSCTSMVNCTADGRSVCLGLYEDLSSRFQVDLLRGYVGFQEIWAARPLSRVVQVAVDGSGARTAWEERYWIGHVNTSPTQPHLLTFCHEGPWNKVDNRIWGLDLQSGQAWKIRPTAAGETVGHEYWYADGVRIGYHGQRADGSKHLGHIRYDNAEPVENVFPGQTGHIHSNDERLIVGDGGSVIRLWRWDGSRYDGPRALCEHRSTMKTQYQHPHPRFSPDGSYVVFTSDMFGYGNVYQVAVPDFASLPPAD